MLPFRLVYSEGYDLRLGDHVFPSVKYKWLHDELLRTRLASPRDFVEPAPATREDLLRAHDAAWVDKLETGSISYQEILKLEIPYSRRVVEAFKLAAGGSVLAARLALKDGLGFNLGGGFHHGFADHGEGFCAINDIAVAIRTAQGDHLIRTAMVVDCDCHHGNGTASIFAGDASVFTLSIHQLHNYPTHKPESDLDIHLPNGVGDGEYLNLLDNACAIAFSRMMPDLLVYVAGADPFEDDRLGGLALTFEGLAARDRLVLRAALSRGVPVAVTLAGGYAYSVEDTVAIHYQTVEMAVSLLREQPWSCA